MNRVGTASAEAILRRFTRNATHPVYQAMLELGRGQADHLRVPYLRDRDLQREIEEGLNVDESWNRVNAVIFFKSGEFATNRRDQQELGMVALHILQAAIVYVNTLMVQAVLALTLVGGRAHRRRPAGAHAAVLDATSCRTGRCG